MTLAAISPWEAAARQFEELMSPTDPDVFGKLGFEPVCKPRVLARMAGTPEVDLPAPCGTCPQERFLNAPDDNLDILYGGAGGGGKAPRCWPTPSAPASGSLAYRRSGSAAASPN